MSQYGIKCLKQYRITFRGNEIPELTMWAHSYERDDKWIQFYIEKPTRGGMAREPVLRMTAFPPSDIQEVKNVRA